MNYPNAALRCWVQGEMNNLLSGNLRPCLVLVFPIRDSLRPELAWQAIRKRQVRYAIDHGRKPEGDRV